jgi:hypothetical protein
MKITGHKARAVFDRYDITSEEDLMEAARKLEALFYPCRRDRNRDRWKNGLRHPSRAAG